MKCEFVESYTSVAGNPCYKWVVTEGHGIVRKINQTNNIEAFVGDFICITKAAFWAGEASFIVTSQEISPNAPPA
jgi:hypothetical protein